MFGTAGDPTKGIGWGAYLYEAKTRKVFARIASAEDLYRPTVANPDLGVVSYHKQFNVIDLGALGSPLIANLASPSGSRADYLLHYAAPDVIELHDYWSCHYDAEILSDPRFEELYRPVKTHGSDQVRKNCQDTPEPLMEFWIRADVIESSKSAERRLIDRMKDDLSAGHLREELERCQSLSTGLHDCVYVARTAWRFLPEFRSRGQTGRLEEIFAGSRTAPFDLYLITGYRDGRAHRAAARFIEYSRVQAQWITMGGEHAEPVIRRSDFDVYYHDRWLLYISIDAECGAEALEPLFFLHVFPKDGDDLPADHRERGFHNLDFRFKDVSAPGGVGCAALVGLPDYEIARIRTGQVAPDLVRLLWDGEIRLDIGAGWIARVVEHAEPVIRAGGFDVYHDGNRLLYTSGECGDESLASRFFLQVFPEDEDDFPAGLREHGFHNIDFRFEMRRLPLGFHFKDAPAPGGIRCAAVVDLPDYEIARIRTGQYVTDGPWIWHGEIRLDTG